MVRYLEYPKKAQNTVKRYNNRGKKIDSMVEIVH